MNNAFNFFVITTNKEIERISISSAVQKSLTDEFSGQKNTLNKLRERKYFPEYRPNSDEILYIENYSLDKKIIEALERPNSIDNIKGNLDRVKCVFFGDHNFVYFQNFDKRKVVSKSNPLTFFFSKDTFKKLEEDVITLPKEISIFFNKEEKKLLFKSFTNASKILDLSSYYKEASDKELGKFIKNKLFYCETKDSFISICNSPIRKKIALIQSSDILEKTSVSGIKKSCNKYQLGVSLKGNRVILPSEPGELKKLISLLNEDYFTSEFKKEKYYTNSKRPIQ